MQITHDHRMTYVIGTFDELVEYAMPRIRQQSKAFYDSEIRRDLERKGTTLIDRHAIGALTRMTLENGNA